MSIKQTEALKLALEALDCIYSPLHVREINKVGAAMAAIREALAEQPAPAPVRIYSQDWFKALESEQPTQQQQGPIRVPVTDNTYGYAKSLAEAIFKQHFASDEHYASGRIVWEVNDTVIGILTQIDNMAADMVRRPEQPAQRTWVGLTDEQLKPLIQKAMRYYGHNPEHWTLTAGAGFCILARAIEAKLREKNA